MKIALSSLDQAWENKKYNMLLCEKHCSLASKNQTDLIVFPEMTLTSYSMNVKKNSEKIKTGESLFFFKELAKKYRMYIVYGYVLDNKGYYNNASVISPKGDTLGEYSKMHLFKFSGENNDFSPGESLCVVKVCGVNIGLTICYDLRFPYLYGKLSEMCDIVINIANWPSKRLMHWDTLLRARAIENQFFMLGVNRTGIDGNNLKYTKSSVCYQPDGERVAIDKSIGKTLDVINLDINTLIEYRKNFNTLSSRLNGVYNLL